MKRMGPKRWIALARERVEREISGHARGSSLGGGLSGEGYSGGYRDALDDVLLLLNGVKPCRRDYYDEPPAEDRSTLRRLAPSDRRNGDG